MPCFVVDALGLYLICLLVASRQDPSSGMNDDREAVYVSFKVKPVQRLRDVLSVSNIVDILSSPQGKARTKGKCDDRTLF